MSQYLNIVENSPVKGFIRDIVRSGGVVHLLEMFMFYLKFVSALHAFKVTNSCFVKNTPIIIFYSYVNFKCT